MSAHELFDLTGKVAVITGGGIHGVSTYALHSLTVNLAAETRRRVVSR